MTDLTAEALLGKTSVSPQGGTDLLEFKVVDGDPRRAALLATSFAEAYVAYRGSLDGRALVRARAEVRRTLHDLRAAGRGGSDLYTSLEEKEQQLATLQTLQTSQATVTTRADDAVQVAPRSKRNLALGLDARTGAGGRARVRHRGARHRGVRSAAEASDRLGLTLLARIPPPRAAGGWRSELPSASRARRASAERYRMLQTNLEFAALTAPRAA